MASPSRSPGRDRLQIAQGPQATRRRAAAVTPIKFFILHSRSRTPAQRKPTWLSSARDYRSAHAYLTAFALASDTQSCRFQRSTKRPTHGVSVPQDDNAVVRELVSPGAATGEAIGRFG